MERIDIDEYQKTIDHGDMTSTQCYVFDNILCAADNEIDRIDIPPIEKDDKYKILTQLGLYYGNMDGVNKLVSWSDEYAVLNLQLFEEFEEKRIVIDSRIDEALCTLYEGSESFKLLQISNYIATRIDYTKGVYGVIEALNGEGVCNQYSIIFYKMASRLGIKTFICYGHVNDGYHAWNMVELNGERYFYDITFYDKLGCKYIRNKSCWGRAYLLNNLWADKIGKEKE